MTCDAIRTLGGASSLALVGTDPDHMLDVEVEDCVEVVAQLRLKPHIARRFWEMIPRQQRSQLVGDLGRLVSAMAVDEVPQLNLSVASDRGLDAISVIAQHVTDIEVVGTCFQWCGFVILRFPA